MRPTWALRTNRSFWIIDTLFMWAPDYAVRQHDRLCPVILYEFQNFVADVEIRAHIVAVGKPAIQGRRLRILLSDDSHRYLRRESVIRPVQRDRCDRKAPETPAGFPVKRQIRASLESHPTSSFAELAALRNPIPRGSVGARSEMARR